MHGGLEPSWNGDLLQTTLNPQPVFPELYYPLWWYSGLVSSPNNTSTQGTVFISKGSTSSTSSYSSSSALLCTINSNWSTSVKYAFEAAIRCSSSSGTAYAALFDITAGSIVSTSQISTTSTTSTVIRSSSFTLIPSHSYAITTWSSVSSYSVLITDASLIIFPQAPLTSPSVSNISLANAGGNTLKEAYIPLWMMSSTSVSFSNVAYTNSYMLRKGSSTSGLQSQASYLYSPGSRWPTSTKFAFEASIYESVSSGYTAHFTLYDISANAPVLGSEISTTSSTSTLIRSGTFTLIPNHVYGIQGYNVTNSYTANINKAHLVALAP